MVCPYCGFGIREVGRKSAGCENRSLRRVGTLMVRSISRTVLTSQQSLFEAEVLSEVENGGDRRKVDWSADTRKHPLSNPQRG